MAFWSGLEYVLTPVTPTRGCRAEQLRLSVPNWDFREGGLLYRGINSGTSE